MSRLAVILACLLGYCCEVFAAQPVDSVSRADRASYVPTIGGVIRARWEAETDNGLNRFALRNARVNVRGKIAQPIDYYLQADLCNEGKFKFLDGWARVHVSPQVALQAGQFRMPCGVDVFRGPGKSIFANRSFIGKYISNVRAVGVKLTYKERIGALPLQIESGVFNPTSITDHTVWTHQKAYAAKLTAEPDDWSACCGFQSTIPDSVRINVADVALTYRRDGWLAECEYMYKHYTGHSHRPTHAVNAFVNYGREMNAGIFNRWSAQGRFDMQTAQSSGERDTAGMLVTTQPARRRITVGSTLSYVRGGMHCDLRVNYEKYFYNHRAIIPDAAGDKVVAELVLVF